MKNERITENRNDSKNGYIYEILVKLIGDSKCVFYTNIFRNRYIILLAKSLIYLFLLLLIVQRKI